MRGHSSRPRGERASSERAALMCRGRLHSLPRGGSGCRRDARTPWQCFRRVERRAGPMRLVQLGGARMGGVTRARGGVGVRTGVAAGTRGWTGVALNATERQGHSYSGWERFQVKGSSAPWKRVAPRLRGARRARPAAAPSVTRTSSTACSHPTAHSCRSGCSCACTPAASPAWRPPQRRCARPWTKGAHALSAAQRARASARQRAAWVPESLPRARSLPAQTVCIQPPRTRLTP
jgi:hypothetical protein